MYGPELRWILILLGVLFLAGLAWWELRRSHQARGTDLTRAVHEQDGRGAEEHSDDEPEQGPPAHREPTLTLPPLGVRDKLPHLTTLEVVDESLEAFEVEQDEEVDLLANETEPLVAPTEATEALEPTIGAAPEPIVEWPGDEVRRILSLRLVAGEERFRGHAVRQALAAEGFVFGKFAIFHRAGPGGRAVLSAADLTRPGTFDWETIDRQRFGGLSLFAVLPGPLPASEAFDALVTAGGHLHERLQGDLQVETGETLTPELAAAMRATLQDASEA